MKRFKKFGAVIFLSAYLLMGLGLTIPTQSHAASFTPQVGIPGSKDFQDGSVTSIGTEGVNDAGIKVMRSDLLARYIAAFYNWGFSIVGVIAVLFLMAAGVIWLTSGGDSGKISNAKKMIEGSLMGSALLLGSWFLLNTINPNLTKMPAIETEIIEKVLAGCCNVARDDSKVKMTTSINCASGFDENKIFVDGSCSDPMCCVQAFTSDGGSHYNACFLSTKNSCLGEINNSICSDLDKCKNTKIIDCSNVKNGDRPANSANREYQYCYNGVVYPSVGNLAEPCGTELYSKCDKDQEQNGKTCIGGSGGRDCGSGLSCCQFNVDGTRINK